MSHKHCWYVVAALALCAAGFTPVRVEAQGFGDRLKRAAADAAKRKVEERVEKKAEAATEATLDGAEKGVKAGVKSASKGDSAAASAKPASVPVTKPAAASTATSSTTPAPTTDAGRDFTPGARVLFATDFARDEVGDFPRAFQLREGNAEVAVVGGARYLRVTSSGEFEIPLPETLPAMFTVEFDFTGPDAQHTELFFSEGDLVHRVVLRARDGGIDSPESTRAISDTRGTEEGVPFRVQIMADGDYAKVYMNGARVANLPNARLGRSERLRFVANGYLDNPVLIGNVRVAAGGKDLYRELAGAGRVTAEGILFDTNSDRLRAESEGVLREIGDMLTQHPELRLAIEGHTDDVGGAAANQTLSQKRAEAVRAHLVSRYGIDAGRLVAQGFGATRPVVRNDGDAARQRNRRVELVKR